MPLFLPIFRRMLIFSTIEQETFFPFNRVNQLVAFHINACRIRRGKFLYLTYRLSLCFRLYHLICICK